MKFLYFDPGMGAMLVQAVVAMVAGVVLFSKGVMFKIKSFFGLTDKKEDLFGDIEIDESDIVNKKVDDK